MNGIDIETRPPPAGGPKGGDMETYQVTTDPIQQDASTTEEAKQMCCDGSGRTTDQHRAESEDHKCCIDT